jgi:hypothetical protein
MMKKQFCSLKKYTTVFSGFSFHCALRKNNIELPFLDLFNKFLVINSYLFKSPPKKNIEMSLLQHRMIYFLIFPFIECVNFIVVKRSFTEKIILKMMINFP